MTQLFAYTHRIDSKLESDRWTSWVTTTKKSEAGAAVDVRVHRIAGSFPSQDQAIAAADAYTLEEFQRW